MEKKGDLNEWLDDWEDADPHHRHISHLYGLYPYDEITPWDTPKLAKAAEKHYKCVEMVVLDGQELGR